MFELPLVFVGCVGLIDFVGNQGLDGVAVEFDGDRAQSLAEATVVLEEVDSSGGNLHPSKITEAALRCGFYIGCAKFVLCQIINILKRNVAINVWRYIFKISMRTKGVLVQNFKNRSPDRLIDMISFNHLGSSMSCCGDRMVARGGGGVIGRCRLRPVGALRAWL
ncbi:hypothetical protein AA12717_0251 [Gluconacetobacter sacchari DSM 12717]|uniref:Uncharacterized protein n=1 Tax=Gluconacetobacter sacchari DSM 12717 TaxID=1307940 RepID=A0ABQ0P2N4_9PROT|nr:hypothetical protein AA12717_0251 [Gluconacetobacter sacchari DSM 12717]